jgi:hypothetical protein
VAYVAGQRLGGLLGENGIVVAKGIAPLRRELPRLLDDGETQLSGLFREMLGEIWSACLAKTNVAGVWPKLKGSVR